MTLLIIYVTSLDAVFSTIPLFFLRFAVHFKLVSGITLRFFSFTSLMQLSHNSCITVCYRMLDSQHRRQLLSLKPIFQSFYFHMLVFCLDKFPLSQNFLRHNIHYSLKCTQIFMEIFTCKFIVFVTCVSFTFQMLSFLKVLYPYILLFYKVWKLDLWNNNC